MTGSCWFCSVHQSRRNVIGQSKLLRLELKHRILTAIIFPQQECYRVSTQFAFATANQIQRLIHLRYGDVKTDLLAETAFQLADRLLRIFHAMVFEMVEVIVDGQKSDRAHA